MATYPPPYPPPPGYDPRNQRSFYRDQARAQARAQRDAFRAQREQMRYQMRSMRRGSIAGPILMIAIGGVFLLVQTGHIDQARFWGWYAQWWPLILVGAGVVVLIEWVVDQYAMRNPEHPQYRRSLGGGIFLLLCVLGFVGFASDHSILHHLDGQARIAGLNIDQDSWDQFFGDKHESDDTLDLPFNGNAVNISNPRGDVTVNGTSDDGRIHIAMHKQVYARSDSDAQETDRQLAPVPVTQGSSLTLRMPSIDGGHADLVVTVPANAAITVTADRGDIHVASCKAAVNVTANRGGIELSAITGAVTAHINNGASSLSAHSLGDGIAVQGHAQDLTLTDITGLVTINGEFFGTTHLEHVNGAIHFHTSRTDLQFARLDGQTEITGAGISADQVMGPVVLATSNRNLTLDRIAGDIAVTNHNGTIDLTAAPAIGNINLQNRNDSIHLTLPAKAAFSVDARTTSNGMVSTDFALQTTGGENGKMLSGTVAGGGPIVRLTTSNNDISILKGDIQPLAGAPAAGQKITLTPPAASKPPKHSGMQTPKAPPPA